MSHERFAPEGSIWVCRACGKTALDRFGIEGERSPGWDESCALNSEMFPVSRLVYSGSRVVSVREPTP